MPRSNVNVKKRRDNAQNIDTQNNDNQHNVKIVNVIFYLMFFEKYVSADFN